MNITEIRQHYTAKNLEAVAEKLSKPKAFKMYSAMESIARIIVGKAAFCAACANESNLQKNAEGHLNEAELWADYLAEQKAKYQK